MTAQLLINEQRPLAGRKATVNVHYCARQIYGIDLFSPSYDFCFNSLLRHDGLMIGKHFRFYLLYF